MNIWFTSDTHWGHRNITGPSVSRWDSGYRNFRTTQEMNDTLISNINKYVKEDDILYHLGDWSFGGKDSVLNFRNSLICKNIHLILGNHDEYIENDLEFYRQHFASIERSYSGYIGKNYFHISHYSHRIWPKSHRGSIHLYGHSHGTLPGFSKSMDVGVDCHKEFRPFHIDEIIKKMDKIEIRKIDHHK